MGILSSERRYFAIAPKAFTADGTSDGIVTISDTCGFKVKRQVRLQSDSIPAHKIVEVKKVLSPTQMVLGPLSAGMDDVEDLSAYTLAANSRVAAPTASRPDIDQKQTLRYVYDEEPTMAQRGIAVDKYGQYYTKDNPIPVKLTGGSTNIGYEKLLPLLANAKWLELVNYEEVTTVFAGDVATLSYLQGGNVIAKAIFTFATDTDWSFKLESYINDDNGNQLLDDDNTSLFLD